MLYPLSYRRSGHVGRERAYTDDARRANRLHFNGVTVRR